MKRVGRILCASVAVAASSAAIAQAVAAYTTQWPLTLARDDGGAYRVTLDETVYRRVQDPALRDLVVLDRAGAPVPTAVFAPQDALASRSRQVDVPWFPLPLEPGDGGVRGWELVSEADADGRLRRVEARITDPAVATLPRSALLVDVSRLHEAIVALELQWRPVDALDVGYRVEASDDLEHWRVLATRGRMIDLQRDGRRLLHRRIELYGLLPQYQQARYLRLTPDRDDVPAITAIAAELALAQAKPEPVWLELPGRRVGNGSGAGYEFEVEGRFPVQAADVVLDGNHAVEWRLESRDDPDAPWQLRAGPWLAYSVDASGVGSRSQAQDLGDKVRDRHWRLRAGTALALAPRLRLGYRPEVVVFLAQGQAPYALAAGSRQSRRVAAPMAALVGQVRAQRGQDWQPSPAYLGAARPLAGDVALQPARDWRSWLLWAVLVLGALVVAGFAFSVLRQSKAPN